MTAFNYAVIVRFSGGGEAQRQLRQMFGTLEGKREVKTKRGFLGIEESGDCTDIVELLV